MLAPVPATHHETNDEAVPTEVVPPTTEGVQVKEEPTELQPASNPAVEVGDSGTRRPEKESSSGVAPERVPVDVVDAGPGFYAAMTLQRERADSVSLAAGGPTAESSSSAAAMETAQKLPSAVKPAPPMPAPQLLQLARQTSLGSAAGDVPSGPDWSFLTFDCVSAESLILMVLGGLFYSFCVYWVG
jgi:hypothetical protein